jgi:uncharacterized protein YdaU (DUF1376 family)
MAVTIVSSPPWMPLYIGDYRADTTHLNAVQHGAYLLLIMHYWQQAGLPDDDQQLARIACMSIGEWRKHRAVLRAFFGEGWRHKRIDREIEQAVVKYRRRAKAGKKGNTVRWGGRNAIAMGSQSQPQSHSLRESPSQREEDLSGLGSRAGGAPTLTVVQGSRAVEDGQ